MKTLICPTCSEEVLVEADDVNIHISSMDVKGVRKFMREKGIPGIIEALKEVNNNVLQK